MSPVKRKEPPVTSLRVILARREGAAKLTDYAKNEMIYVQGDAADAVFYLDKGNIKLTVSSPNGKEAVIGILGPGDFFGEACLAGRSLRVSSAVTLSECSVMQLAQPLLKRLLQEESLVAEAFVAYVLARNIRIEEDLVDQFFNSCEKRLARLLLLLANFGSEDCPELVISKMSQETLAEMIGTTRSRVNFFMNRFRKRGFIEYNGDIKVYRSLLNVVLND